MSAPSHVLTRRRAGLLLMSLCALPAAHADRKAATAPRTMTWEELVPKGWDPLEGLRDMMKEGGGLSLLSDGDPRAMALMRELRARWDAAPVRAELDGTRVKLPGYVVPLQQQGGQVSELLLVPYFGACIHTPPPPANQIVHAALDKPLPLRSMDVVWATGTLRTRRHDGGMGTSGYALEGLSVEPYKAPAR